MPFFILPEILGKKCILYMAKYSVRVCVCVYETSFVPSGYDNF